MLFECILGFPPFDGADGYSIGYKHVHEAPVTPHDVDSRVPVALSHIILKCLAKTPAERYERGADLADALLEFLHISHSQTPARVRTVRASGPAPHTA